MAEEKEREAYRSFGKKNAWSLIIVDTGKKGGGESCVTRKNEKASGAQDDFKGRKCSESIEQGSFFLVGR